MGEAEARAGRWLFRRVELGCVVQLGGRTYAGYTVHVGPDELALRLETPLDPDTAPNPGAAGPFRLVHAADTALSVSGTAELLAITPGEPPRQGTEFALRVTRGQEAFARFIEQLRFPILLIAADDQLAARLGEGLTDLEVTRASDPRDALGLLAGGRWTTVVYVEDASGPTAADFLEAARAYLPSLSAVVATQSNTSTPELLARVDVFHILRPPFRPAELAQAARRAVEAQALAAESARLAADLERIHRRLQRENAFLKQRAAPRGFDHLIGQSARWRETLDALRKAVDVDTSLHLHGETGTGKELLARAVHAAGPRSSKPFVAYNCAGIPDELAVGIFFGHRRGAFTGAENDHPGLFQQADGGTLFLDEVAELPPRVQALLLRALQEREITPLGARAPVPVDVRLISATHADLLARTQDGAFREDLYFRLVVLTVTLPTLHERVEDIPLLARHFLSLHAARFGRTAPALSDDALAVLTAHPWPGNVRELENECERLAIAAEPGVPVPVALLSAEIRRAASASPPPAGEAVLRIPMGLPFDDAVRLLQRRLVAQALTAADQNATRAAQALGIERTRFAKLRNRLGRT